MTDNQMPFTYPDIEQGVSNTLVAPNVSPLFKIGKLIWGSLIGKNNEEIVRESLFNSQNFVAYIASVKQDFIANNTNTVKYPKMDEDAWE